MSPGNVGVCHTRALLAELLAVRLLKEFTTRELIDVLSYDFNPLSGISPQSHASKNNQFHLAVTYTRAARTSTLEVAIRAQAKRFLAHPLVVQHLEAIWAGTVVFHSAADSLHRMPTKPAPNHNRHYGATHQQPQPQGDEDRDNVSSSGEVIRRSVSLYDTSNASIFKLSRLRVPRYRQVFSTISYAIMLGLFLTVLIEKSLDITPLEVVFWFWSAGFMLDEIIGFTEQGFGLYIMNVWNAFDIGILFLFFIYYVLRLYGVIMEDGRKHQIASMAYDVLASTAVLLFPRLFSVLDHYRYFSQLLIAFRIMAQDLAAVLMLIGISCSGFFVAFTLSFGDRPDAGGIAYALFQILMGFTPAAWERWNDWNLLGKAIMTLFLIICHFLVVTILITVLTNSFMKIVQNADEEHQFLFAINTISMVKSEADTLFSYIAPANLVGWLTSPLRYCIPFRVFIKTNRTIIKFIHFPILCTIFIYEKFILARKGFEPLALVERHGTRSKGKSTFGFGVIPDLFSPSPRLRKNSIATYHKDRALAEVFRKPFSGDLRLSNRSGNSQLNVVDTWMHGMGEDGGANPPLEEPRGVLERLETKRSRSNKLGTPRATPARRRITPTQQLNYSDPDNRATLQARFDTSIDQSETSAADDNDEARDRSLDDDGDDELAANEEDEVITRSSQQRHVTTYDAAMQRQDSKTSSLRVSTGPYRKQRLFDTPSGNYPNSIGKSPNGESAHQRISSTNTIVFKPLPGTSNSSGSSPRRSGPKHVVDLMSRPPSSRVASSMQHSPRYQARYLPIPANPRPPNRSALSRPQRPAVPHRDKFKSAPNLARLLEMSTRADPHKPSFDAIALDLASDIGDNRHVTVGPAPFGPRDDEDAHMLSASFQTQLAMATGVMHKRNSENDASMISRIVLARMATMEEGFKDILKEVKGLRKVNVRGVASRGMSAGENESVATAGKRTPWNAERRGLKMAESEGRAETHQQVTAPAVSAAASALPGPAV